MDEARLAELLNSMVFYVILGALAMIVYLQRGMTDEEVINHLSRHPGWGWLSFFGAVFLLVSPTAVADFRLRGLLIGAFSAYTVVSKMPWKGVQKWIVSREHLSLAIGMVLGIIVFVAFILPAVSGTGLTILVIVLLVGGGIYLVRLSNQNRAIKAANGKANPTGARVYATPENMITREQGDKIVAKLDELLLEVRALNRRSPTARQLKRVVDASEFLANTVAKAMRQKQSANRAQSPQQETQP